MKYYYCPSCKKQVGGQMNTTQIVVAALLCIIFVEILCIPGIIYVAACKKKCPICGTPVEKRYVENTPNKKGKK